MFPAPCFASFEKVSPKMEICLASSDVFCWRPGPLCHVSKNVSAFRMPLSLNAPVFVLPVLLHVARLPGMGWIESCFVGRYGSIVRRNC